MTIYEYWSGTVVCPRKGISHISGKMCLDLYSDACGECRNKDAVLQQMKEEAEAEEEGKRQCRAESSRRGHKKKQAEVISLIPLLAEKKQQQ